jgi:carbamoyltransferase
VRDGTLVAAAEEERFRRLKHWAGFPTQSIAYCLGEAELTLADVDHLALNQNSRANWLRKVDYLITSPPSLALLWERGVRDYP